MASRVKILLALTLSLTPAFAHAQADAPAGAPTTAPADDKARKTGLDLSPTLKSEFKLIDNELKFSDEQKPKVQAAYAAKAQALSDWDTKNKAKLIDLKNKSRNAKSTERDVYKADLEFLEDERKELEKKTSREVLETLTPEQKQAWTASSLNRRASRFYGRVNLKEDQKKQILEQAEKSAKGLDLLDEKTFRVASKEVRTYAEYTVFTDQQKDLWRKSKATDRARQEDNDDEPDPQPEDEKSDKDKKDKTETKVDNTKPKSGFLDTAAADAKKKQAPPPAAKQQAPANKTQSKPAQQQQKSPYGPPVGQPMK